MPNPKNVHVTYNKDDENWRVRSEGAQRAAGVYDTKAEALNAGRTVAENKSGELFIHNRDGKISDRDSFGNDPNPPKDTIH